MEGKAIDHPPRLFTDRGTLATDTCARCGYALVGAPSTGRCPECGQDYDDSVLLIYGHGVGVHERVSNASKSRVAWLTVLGLLVLIPYFFNMSRYGWTWMTIMAATFIVPRALELAQRKSSRHPGLAQVRLNAYGCVQHDDLTGPSMAKDLAPYVMLLLLPAMMLVVGRDIGTYVPFWIVVAMVPVALMVKLGWHALRRELPPGAAKLTDDWQPTQPSPWKSMPYVTVGQRKDDVYRMRIRSTESFWKWRGEPVHIEFSATPHDVDVLREYIEAWRSGAAWPSEEALRKVNAIWKRGDRVTL